jgi:hypothetical protein
MRFWSMVVAAIAWAALAATGTAAAEVEGEPPVAFAETDALSISCAALSAGKVRVPIRNETALEQKVSYELQLSNENGNPVDEANVCGGLRGARGTVTLAPGGTTTIKLGAGEEADARKISGSFVLHAEKGRVARRDVSISDAQPGRKLEATPLVGKVSNEVGTSDHGPLWVPIEGEPPHDLESGEGTRPVTLGALVGPGDPIAVTYKGEAKALNGDSAKVGLDLDGDLEPGTYTGKVDLNPSDAEAGTVELELKVSRSWILAALTLFVGILVGAFLPAASGRMVPSARLRGRLAALETRYGKALAALQQADGGGKGWNGFTIDNISSLQTPIEERIKEATEKVLIQIEKSALEGIESEIGIAETKIDFLKEVPEHAKDLEAALQLQQAMHLPTAREDRPALEGAAREALVGKPIKVEALKPLLDEMDGRANDVKRLRRLERVLESSWLERRTLRGRDKNALDAVKHTLEEAQKRLWEAKGMDELEDVDRELQKARGELTEIWREKSEPTVVELQKVTGDDEEEVQRFAALVEPQPTGLPAPREELLPSTSPAPAVPPPPANVGEAIKRARRVQWAIVALSALLAIAAGLGFLYFGKTWGTTGDFVVAFIWGIAGQAVVTNLATSLDGLAALNWLRRT